MILFKWGDVVVHAISNWKIPTEKAQKADKHGGGKSGWE